MKWRDPNVPAVARPRVETAPAGARLTYYGGRVVSNMQVVQVLWGTGSYLSNVSSTASPSIATFYQAVLNSAYVDWFDSEYNTVNPTPVANSTKTNQHIGRGSFLQQVTITPSSSSASISDATIQSEISAQIQAGHLPAPTHDAAGNNNTYYAIFFPHGKSITQGGSGSCVAGGFCAYHGTIQNVPGQGEVYYGVHPDMQSGSGCDTGCGTGTPFGNYTSVASHEMTETITDCEVGLASTNAPPLAWYDSNNGEIGDICNAQQGSIVGPDGVTYTVQQEFSNGSNDCIVSKSVTPPTNDFSISDAPAALTIQTGTSGTSTISTAVTSGSAATVTLAASGAPAGVTVSLSASSVTAGASATATVAVASTAAAGSYTITITGTEGTKTHSAAIALTVTTTTPPPPSGIVNGDFETGTLSGWTAAGTTANTSTGCHGGAHCAMVGSANPTNGDSSVSQTFTATTGATGISFWTKVVCPDTVTYDWATVTLKDNTAGTTATLLAKTCSNSGAWVNTTGAVTAGHSYTVTLTSHDDNYAGDPTYTLYDDVTLTTTAPPPPGGITNGGFETGSLSGWTAAGTTSVTTSGPHGGTYAAQLGSTSPTNGDSSVTQTFTAPAGTSTLTFYYEMSCPDTVTYDWFTATLKDNTAGTTSTVVAKTCATSSTYVAKSAAVTAGHSYTLTLTSHDDNYAGDPTYTKVDDISVQ
jgi:hypothetical protein